MFFKPLESITQLDAQDSRDEPYFNWQLGHILISEKAITDDQLEQALEYQDNHKGRLGNALMDLGFTSEDIIHQALIKKFGIPKVSLKEFQLSEETFNLISFDMAIRYTILPLTINDNRLFLAMADPMDWQVISEIADYTGLSVEPVLATSGEIQSVISIYRRCADLMQMKQRISEAQVTDILAEKKANIPNKWITQHKILPLAVVGQVLFLAMENPENKMAITLVGEKTGLLVEPIVASQVELDKIAFISKNNDRERASHATTRLTRLENKKRAHSQSLAYTPYPSATGVRKIGCGSTIKGRFMLEAVLGAGGMGTVYKAIDLRRQEANDYNCYVALKILHESVKDHPSAYVSMQQEASKTQRLQHKNIVTVNDFDRDGETIYITMEYLEGRSLGDLQKYGYPSGIPLPKLCDILTKVASALAFAHQHHIIHCDFKPGNVFVTHDDAVKVIDFGIAKSSSTAEQDMKLHNDSIMAACTPSYATKELFYGEEPLPSDDVYALACVTYKMLTGKHPYHGHGAVEAERLGLKPERIKQLTHSQWKGLLRGLSFSRKLRTRTVEKFLNELKPSKFKIYLLIFVLLTIAGAFSQSVYFYLSLFTA